MGDKNMSDKDYDGSEQMLDLIWKELIKSNETQEKILQAIQHNNAALSAIEDHTNKSNYHVERINEKTKG
jgi:hypothetical protein